MTIARKIATVRSKAALKESKGKVLGGLHAGTAARNAAVKADADDHAATIWLSIQMLRNGGTSLGAVADELNCMGFSTARGGASAAQTVANVKKRMTA